jgi:hypothetical protein
MKFLIQHAGVSGMYYDYRTVNTIEEARDFCAQLKADGYGFMCHVIAGTKKRRLWWAPWQIEFHPDMAASRAFCACVAGASAR